MNTNLSKLFETPLQDTLADKLGRLSPIKGTTFESSVWVFRVDTRSTLCTLDFSIFSLPYLQFEHAISIKQDSHEISLTLVNFAKIIWLEAIAGKSPTGQLYYAIYNILAGLFAFLYERKSDCLERSDLEAFYGFCLTQDVTMNGIKRRLSPPSFGNRLEVISLPALARLMSKYSVKGLIGNMTDKHAVKAMNTACQTLMNMTLAQYKEGGSFNFLGLDIGKHYIDHCNNVFEEHYAFSVAIQETITECLNNKVLNDKDKLSNANFTKVLGSVLTSIPLDDIRAKYRVKMSTIEEIRDHAYSVFRESYIKSSTQINAFKIDTINCIVKACALPIRYDTQEFVRSLLFIDMFSHNEKSKESIWQEYAATCSEKESIKFDLTSFEQTVKRILGQKKINLPSDAEDLRVYLKRYLQNLPISIKTHHFSGVRFLKFFVVQVAQAGLTCWVGLTGWRSGEYGFPLSAVGININPEPSDNHYTPWRFNVKWKVPKTSGETLLEREITLSSYIFASHLARLNSSGSFLPALYPVDSNSKQMGKSASPVKSAVSAWWRDFVVNYCLFKDLDRWEILSNKHEQLNDSEKSERLTLEGRYNFESSAIIELNRIRKRVKKELPVVALTLNTSSGYTFGDRLRMYLAGELDSEIALVLEKSISQPTMDKLKSGDYELTQAGIMFVRNEMLGDAVYPTPHAFRHVWAEAVLRRYRGDIGKFIRANFKHLDERFFMAYLRDKEMRVINQVATRTAISSIVRKQLLSVNDKHRDYSGGFDRYVVKAVNITHVVSLDEYEKLSLKISEEKVLSMKSNPWSSCFLRIGTENSAKCSIGGIPQRQDAEPKLCLGCVNANIAEGNFIGIVVYTKHDVATCRNPRLPYFIKEPHIEVVNLALKRVLELRDNCSDNKYDPFIEHLEETLKIVQQEGQVK
jgi:hypothetical protein